jgi:hypothetical protein
VHIQQVVLDFGCRQFNPANAIIRLAATASRLNLLEQTTPRVDDLHMVPRIVRRRLRAFQNVLEGPDPVFEPC